MKFAGPSYDRSQVHALELLRRRLRTLFGNRFRLEVSSEVGKGTTVTLRIPLQRQFGLRAILKHP
jgi:LytS/YehU family sensor histidine kinase